MIDELKVLKLCRALSGSVPWVWRLAISGWRSHGPFMPKASTHLLMSKPNRLNSPCWMWWNTHTDSKKVPNRGLWVMDGAVHTAQLQYQSKKRFFSIAFLLVVWSNNKISIPIWNLLTFISSVTFPIYWILRTCLIN